MEYADLPRESDAIDNGLDEQPSSPSQPTPTRPLVDPLKKLSRRDKRAATTRFQGNIEVRNLRFRYDPSLPWLLKHVNVDIPAGSKVAGTASSESSYVIGKGLFLPLSSAVISVVSIELSMSPMTVIVAFVLHWLTGRPSSP